MKRWNTPLALSCLIVAVGCNQWNNSKDSAAQSHGTNKPVIRDEGSSAVLALYTPIVEVHQGETKSVTASIERQANTDGDVELRFSEVPQGVSFNPPHPVIKRHGIEGNFSVVIAHDAAVGEHTIRATAHPQNRGADFVGSISLKITGK